MTQKEFSRRRRQLMKMMGKQSIALLPAATERTRNRDVDYVFRQDSDFLYLSGFSEPDALIVLIPGREHGEYLLFCRERDPEQETWHGRRAGQDGAVQAYGADDSFPIDDVDDILPGLLERCKRVYSIMGRYPDFDQKVTGWVNQIRHLSRSGAQTPYEFISLDHMLHDMRLYKSRAELGLMRKAAKLSVAAHERAMRFSRSGAYEFEVEAEITHEFRRHNADHAYPPIVGGGENGCILHYTENNTQLNEGELLLIDAGSEVQGYASDITRTFPVGGKFSKEQKALYEVVLDAQSAAIETIRPGAHWNDPHNAAVRVITEGLVRLKILKGEVDQLIEDKAYFRFYMHRTGHWLGLDVHDVGDYRPGEQWRLLEPGMVMTVEPGLYIPGPSKGVAKKWWNIGIRIEDDVAVTREGHEILTGALAKTVDEIEALMAS